MTVQRKRLFLAAIAALLATAAILTLFGFASRAAEDLIRKKSDDIAGVAIELERMEVGWLSARLILRGVKIYPAGQKGRGAPMGSAAEISVRIAPLALLRGRLHIRTIALDAPEIRYLCSGNRCNWDAFDFGTDKKKNPAKEGDGDSSVRIDAITIEDGTLLYRDRSTGKRLDLRSLDAEVDDIEAGSDADDLPTSIRVQAKLGKTDGKVRITGSANVLREGINFKLKGTIRDAPVTVFAPFYAGSLPFRVEGGTVALSGKGRAKHSDLTAHAHVTVRDLRAGGIDGMLINKLVLKRAGTLELDVAIAGNLDRGDFAVSSALSKNIGNMILADAKKISPVHEAGKKLKELGEGVGKKVEKVFGR